MIEELCLLDVEQVERYWNNVPRQIQPIRLNSLLSVKVKQHLGVEIKTKCVFFCQF